jgi:ATP-dependent Lon protease
MNDMLEAVDFTSLYPVLPLRDIVVFPHMIVPLFVGREKSIRALDEVVRDNQKILLVTQKDAKDDEPQVNNIYRVGTLGHGAAAAEAAGWHG